MPSNSAAWLVAEKATPFEVKPAPYPTPSAHEIVVKNSAVAINPVDAAIQTRAIFPHLRYPTILGADLAGEVVEVGSSVTRFHVGDRVLGHADGITSRRDSASAFQEYTLVNDNVASPIPSSVSFEAACVIPLCLSVAACSLYQKDFLALQYPSVDPQPTAKTLLLWGGASSVGCNGIQLAVASGYEVITTASPKNFDYVKKLGASQVFDYNSKNIVEDLVTALKGKTVVGALDCISYAGATEFCAEILAKCEGTKMLVTVRMTAAEFAGGVKAKMVFGTIPQGNEVGMVVYEDYLPMALAEGKFVPAPEPLVVGRGLQSIQLGCDTVMKGVSATKVVVSL